MNRANSCLRIKAVPGSNMLDLLKNVTAPHQVRDDRRPLGWSEFLHAFAELNIPFSTVPNQHVRSTISSLKNTPGALRARLSLQDLLKRRSKREFRRL